MAFLLLAFWICEKKTGRCKLMQMFFFFQSYHFHPYQTYTFSTQLERKICFRSILLSAFLPKSRGLPRRMRRQRKRNHECSLPTKAEALISRVDLSNVQFKVVELGDVPGPIIATSTFTEFGGATIIFSTRWS